MTTCFETPIESTTIEFSIGTPSTREISLPRWETKTIEATRAYASDVNDSTKTRNQKQRGSVALVACILDACDHDTYVDAGGQPKWANVMVVKHHSVMKNQIWDLVPQPKEMNLVKCPWVYKTMFTSKGVVENRKAGLVAKVFSQQEGIDYTKTFAPIAKIDSTRLILSSLLSLNRRYIKGMSSVVPTW